jgi:hypothetical protein
MDSLKDIEKFLADAKSQKHLTYEELGNAIDELPRSQVYKACKMADEAERERLCKEYLANTQTMNEETLAR